MREPSSVYVADDDEALSPSDLLVEILLFLGCNPEKISVAEEAEGDFVRLTVRVDPADLGQVIGRNGDRIGMLRKLIGGGMSARGKKISISLIEPGKTYPRKREAA